MLTNIKYLVHKYASETHLRPFCVCLLLLIPSSGLFSLRFHGSAERAIASASVWRRGDAALGGCGQTPGSAVTRSRAGGGQEHGSGGGGLGVRWSTDVARTAWVDGEGAESQT